MTRVKDGAAVLMEHNAMMRCGITEGGEVTGNRTVEADVRFARNDAGNAALSEIEDGTLKWISVGYRIEEAEEDDDGNLRATRWTPLEVSLVGIPADPTAKVLRSNQTTEHPAMITRSIKLAPDAKEPSGGGTPEPQLDADGNQIEQVDASRSAMDAEIREVMTLGHKWEPQYSGALEKAEELCREGKDVEKSMRRWLMDEFAKRPVGGKGGTVNDRAGSPALSYGEAFCRTEQYKKFGKSVGNKRTITCEMPDRLQFRTTFSATTESLTSIQKLPGVPGILDQQPLMIADLFGQGTTSALTVRYIQEDAFTNAATAVAEGGTKPEATLNVSEVDATVRKIAVWTKVTDEMLADFDQMSSYINSRLSYMVQALEDNHLLNGTGNTNTIKGVLAFTGLQTVDGSGSPLDGVMKAIAYVRGANGAGFGEPTAIIMNPKDWMNAKLTKDGNQQYYGGGPFSGIYGNGMYSNVYNMWGLPCVVTTSIAQGTALVGDFRTAAQIFRRKGLTIESTNSNEDDFKNNLVMLRAEERLALAVYQPNKFCKVTGIPNI